MSALVACTPAVCLGKLCSNSRRPQASKVHSVGAWAGATGPVAACGFRPIADNRPDTRPVMTLPGVAGALTAVGAGWVMTAAALTWKPAVETTGFAAAVTVRDALVVGITAASRGRDAADAAGAVVLATLTETFEVVLPLDGEPASEDLRRGVDVEMLELLLLADGVDFVACADDDAEVDTGVDVPEAAAVLALVVEVLAFIVAVVGLVLVVPVPVTEVLASPEACTTLARRSVEDPD